MTIREVIAAVAQRRQPGLNEEEYLKVINDVEAKALREVIEPDGGEITDEWAPMTMEDADKELLICSPYDDAYVLACCEEVDDRENQIGNLNNTQRIFYLRFGDWARYYTRTHGYKRRRMFGRWWGI